MHPLVSNLEQLSESELENKIFDLSKKYYMTQNPDLHMQIVLIIEDYRTILNKKHQEALQTAMANRNKGLDNLINID